MNPINITSHDWLNGLIYAFGVKQTKHIMKIIISNFPCNIIDEIIEDFESDGFFTEIVDTFNAFTKQMDLRLCIAKPEVFMEDMVKISDRRISFNESREFLYGFLLNLSRPTCIPTFDGIKISCYMPKEDIVKLVEMFGITKYKLTKDKFLNIKKEDIGDCEPFKTLYDNYALEIDELTEQYGDQQRKLSSLLDTLIYENNLGHESPFAK